MNVLLVDDEYLALSLLGTYLGQLQPADEWRVVGQFQQPLQALDFLSREAVDILFLDVQMPRLSGTELLRALPPGAIRPIVVFTTAYDQYAVEAFGLDAVDYLPKPFSFPRFLQAAQKARAAVLARNARTEAAASVMPVAVMAASAAPPTAEAYLSIRAGGQYRRILFEHILFVEGWSEYVRIHTAQGVITVNERLKNVEAQLAPARFLRVHKSFIVAMAHVESLEGSELHIAAHRIPISRVHRDEALARLFNVGG